MTSSAHLLRTLASVAPGARIVDAACGDGRHLVPLARLGFDVWGATEGDPAPARARLGDVVGEAEAQRRVTAAPPDALGRPDAWAHWVVLVLDGLDAGAAMAEAARVLQPGGWVWTEAAAESAESVRGATEAAGLVVAEAIQEEAGRVHAVFRRPGAVG